MGKDTRYKFFWSGNDKGTGGVGILLAEKWVEHVLEVKRISDRICAIKINVGFIILTIFSIYAPQVGLDDEAKDSSYDELFCAVSKTAKTESLFLCGDFNGHVGSMSGGYEGVHGGYGYVSSVIDEKRRLWKVWKKGGSKQEYLTSKRTAKSIVRAAKRKAEASKFASVEKDDKDVFRIAKQMKKECKDVVGECCVKDDQGHISLTDDAKKNAWREYYNHLLNVEFSWSHEDLPPAYPVEGPPILVTSEMVAMAVCKMKQGKAAGPCGVVAEMVKASDEVSIPILASLSNAINA
ncbi:uncharacterized protein LOC125570198 [Nematostella vectensis]|uniref:uncharacterized protein LOC125570198 n=1 Tax=Nematostella vectensis TaxID=45351 RepID=UPI0020775708|nr:uncharacterized protein LOC125570198 [Nematostella vectensis]